MGKRECKPAPRCNKSWQRMNLRIGKKREREEGEKRRREGRGERVRERENPRREDGQSVLREVRISWLSAIEWRCKPTD